MHAILSVDFGLSTKKSHLLCVIMAIIAHSVQLISSEKMSLPEHLTKLEKAEQKEFTDGIKKLVSTCLCSQKMRTKIRVNQCKYRVKTM